MTTTLPAPAVAGTTTTSPLSAVRRWALIGTAVLALLVIGDLNRLGGNPLGLIQPGETSNAAPAFHEDFPDIELPNDLGLDGQVTYAMARQPWSTDSAEYTDRPRYRLQRALPSWVAGTVFPGRGGFGLVWTIFGLQMAAVYAGALAIGKLSVRWGGPAWVGALFCITPGAFMAVRTSCTDVVAVGLAMLAVWLARDGRHGWAIAAGVAAVLSKEPAMLILAGWALAHRSRRDAAVAVVPALALVGWMAVLRVLLPGYETLGGDIGLPGAGLWFAWRDIWSEGREVWGLVSTLAGLALGVLALRRGRLRHPLGWAVAANLAYVLVAGMNPLGTSFGGTRTTLGLMATSIVVLAAPHARRTGPGWWPLREPVPSTAPDAALVSAGTGTGPGTGTG